MQLTTYREFYSPVARLLDSRYSASVNANAKFDYFSGITNVGVTGLAALGR